jgi:hypothetical protein
VSGGPTRDEERRNDAVPIGCTLEPKSRADRGDEWRAFVASFVVALDNGSDNVRFVLHDSDDALVAAASLGGREKRCCAFFDVTIEVEPDQRALRLSVPPGAEEALAAFVESLRS